MPPRLAPEVIQDRLDRYAAGEPLAMIAEDHGIALWTLIATAHRYAPWLIGERARGGGRREWPVEAKP